MPTSEPGSRPRRSPFTAVLLAALLLVGMTGCSPRQSLDSTGLWLSDKFSGARKPVDPTPLEKLSLSTEPRVVWKKRLSRGLGRGYPLPLPVLSGDRVFSVASASRRSLAAYAIDTRKRIWRHELPMPITSGVGAGDGLVLAGDGSGHLYALNAENGEELWVAQLTSEVLAPPVAKDGVVVAATGDGRLAGLDRTSGEQKWLVEREVPRLSLRGTAPPVISDGLAIHGFADGHLVAVDLYSGLEVWDAKLAAPSGRTEIERMVDADGGAIVDNSVVYSSTFQGRVAAIGIASGEVLWAHPLSSSLRVALDGFNVYALSDNDQVVALDRRSGAEYWRQEALTGRRLSSPVVAEGYVVVGDYQGYLHWLDSDSGEFVARSRVSRDPIIATQVYQGQLYVFDKEGVLRGVTLRGKEATKADDAP